MKEGEIMSITKAEVIEFIKNMSVLELSKLVKELEEVFDVSAAAPMPIATLSGSDEAKVVEEQTEFDVILESVGSAKIQVIKVVRAITNLGLKEAKDLVDGAPRSVKEAVSKEEADGFKTQLEEVGAVVTIK